MLGVQGVEYESRIAPNCILSHLYEQELIHKGITRDS